LVMCVAMSELELLASGELEPLRRSTKRGGSLLARLGVGLGVSLLVRMVTYRPPMGRCEGHCSALAALELSLFSFRWARWVVHQRCSCAHGSFVVRGMRC
jgi:hypothetical protein